MIYNALVILVMMARFFLLNPI